MKYPPRPFKISAVLFDFDGTLTHPGALDFPRFARSIGCPAEHPVLEWIQARPDAEERRRCADLLEEFELEAAARSFPNPGAEEAIASIRSLGVKLGVLTRNGRASIDRALANFSHLSAAHFDLIITRDTPLPPKPAPDGILHAADLLSITPAEIMLVGDYVLDLCAARRAGSVGVLLLNKVSHSNHPPWRNEADYIIASLEELPQLVMQGLPLPGGKLPPALLSQFFAGLPTDDPSLIVRPGIGQDVACVQLTAGRKTELSPEDPLPELLALKTDPITFTTTEPAAYAVRVNANDLITCGAHPRWFLATVLLPMGTTPSQAQILLYDLAAAVTREGLTLCGGHTEVTDAVSRPVIVGFAAGTLQRADLRDKCQLRPGDRLLLTKRVAVEGTALLAGEAASLLRSRGMSDTELASCRALLDQLSVVPEGRIALGFQGVRAMHDVTEGGLATAVVELSEAAGRGILVELDRIPLYPETRRMCSLLGIDALGLIGSGSMLIGCAQTDTPKLIAALDSAGIEATVLGEVLDTPPGVSATQKGAPANWPVFAVDEVARFFQEASSGQHDSP